MPEHDYRATNSCANCWNCNFRVYGNELCYVFKRFITRWFGPPYTTSDNVPPKTICDLWKAADA